MKEFNIHDIINELMKELQEKGIPFEYTVENEGFGGHYKDNGNVKNGRKHSISIFIGNEEDFMQNGMVNEERLMGLISTIYHEYRHLEQTEKYKYSPDFSKDSIEIAKMNAIQTNGFANYYFENYRYDLKELDATKYSIEESVAYVSEIYPDIDATRGIQEYIHSYIEEDRNNPYGFHMFDENNSDTVQDILKQLQERIDNPTRENLSKVCEGYIEDDKLLAAFTDDFIKSYEDCNSVEEKDSLIFAEVFKLHPEILSEYPVLQNEIEKKDSQRKQAISPYINEYGEIIRPENTPPNADEGHLTGYTWTEKSRIYTETMHQNLNNALGQKMGERTIIETTNIENASRSIETTGNMENEDGKYVFYEKSEGIGSELTRLQKKMTRYNKTTGQKEEFSYLKDDKGENYVSKADGQIRFKIVKTNKGFTIDTYRNGQPYATYEYDENGKAIVGMDGIEKIGEDFVEQYFDGNVPYFEAVGLDKSTQENNNKPIDILNSAVKATEETIRTSTINEQAQTIKTVQRDKQSTRQQEEYKENPETKTKSNDNPESFRDTLKFNVSSEMRQEILNRHQETELDFAEGKMDKPEKHKIEDTEYGVR